jgi:hypothetical protein
LAAPGKAETFQDETEKRVVNFADQLARTLAKALRDAEAEKDPNSAP